MYFHISTVNSPAAHIRQADVAGLMDSYDIPYTLYKGELTPLHYDGLYETAKRIIRDNYDKGYVIFAEDDLILTEHFSIPVFEEYIKKAKDVNTDVLVTGCLNYYSPGKTAYDGLIEIGGFRGTQLVVVYQQAYDMLLEYPTYNHFEDTISMGEPRLKKVVTFPFLSKQRTDIPSFIVAENHNEFFNVTELRLASWLKNTI
jgi:hypothetical protein